MRSSTDDQVRANRAGIRRSAIKWVAFILIAGVFSSETMHAGEVVKEGKDGRSLLQEWIGLRKAISDEGRKWELRRELLKDRIELARQSISSLRESIGKVEEGVLEADKKRSGLVEREVALKEATVGVRGRIGEFESRVKVLLKQIPVPVQEKVKALSQRFPDDPESIEASASKRYQYLIGVLAGINKANREVSVNSEIRTLADGSTLEVAVLYIGISQAYFVNIDKTVAGVGVPFGDGWSWTPANDAAEKIAHAIAIHDGEKPAEYIPLPVTIDQKAE